MHNYYEFVEIDGKIVLRSKKTGKIIGKEDDWNNTIQSGEYTPRWENERDKKANWKDTEKAKKPEGGGWENL